MVTWLKIRVHRRGGSHNTCNAVYTSPTPYIYSVAHTRTHHDAVLRGQLRAVGAGRLEGERAIGGRGQHLDLDHVHAFLAASQGSVGPGHGAGLRVKHGGTGGRKARRYSALNERGVTGQRNDEARLLECHARLLLVDVGKHDLVADGRGVGACGKGTAACRAHNGDTAGSDVARERNAREDARNLLHIS